MLIENTLYGEVDKVKVAINRLKLHEPKEGYYLAFSGGKDSCVCYELCKMAGVKFTAHYHVTTVDPPELIYFIREHYPDAWENRTRPKKSMWQLIVAHGILPQRQIRYCCKELKEDNGKGRVVITGVRRAESVARSKRYTTEICQRGYVHPIFDWSTNEVWEFIKKYNVPYCPLYDEGFHRLGCIGCPFASKAQREKEFARWPNYKRLYLKACKLAFEARAKKGKPSIQKSYEDYFEWWLENKSLKKEDEALVSLFGIIGDESML